MNPFEVASALQRRHLLRLGLGGAMLSTGVRAAPTPNVAGARQHFPFGPVLPTRPAPALPLRTHTGFGTDVGTLLRGRVSAVQLMFAGCSATCPIQGALFAQTQQLLGARLAEVQLVSITIDPLSDSPAVLAAWLRRFQGRLGWIAATPRVEDVARIIAWLGDGGDPRPQGMDPHSGQVYIVNRSGELAYRTTSMPPTSDIVAALRIVAAYS